MSDAKADRKQYQITVNGNRFAIASPHGEVIQVEASGTTNFND